MNGVTLHLGLPDPLRADAARLYWQAFGAKLGKVMGPELQAMRFLMQVMRADQVITALSHDGRLLGIAGFKTQKGGFAAGQPGDLRTIYGPLGALWRETLLGWLADEVDNERFLLDGLCVDASARGQGLGAALLNSICTEAHARGYQAVRLEVVDTNLRAIALYKRLGFAVAGQQNIGLLRHVYGFSSALTMIRAV